MAEQPVGTQVYQIFVRASAEQMWDATTKSEFRAKYFHGGSVESTFEPGAPMRSLGPGGQLWGDNIVLESQPPHRLVHTWQSLYDPEMAAEPESRVTWLVEEQEGGFCKLSVIHDRLEQSPKTARSVTGWMQIISGLKSVLETGEGLTVGA